MVAMSSCTDKRSGRGPLPSLPTGLLCVVVGGAAGFLAPNSFCGEVVAMGGEREKGEREREEKEGITHV